MRAVVLPGCDLERSSYPPHGNIGYLGASLGLPTTTSIRDWVTSEGLGILVTPLWAGRSLDGNVEHSPLVLSTLSLSREDSTSPAGVRSRAEEKKCWRRGSCGCS